MIYDNDIKLYCPPQKVKTKIHQIVVGYKDIYQLGVNRGNGNVNKKIKKKKLLTSEEIKQMLCKIPSKRELAASIIFDLLKKFGISLFAPTKLLPTWRQP